MSMSYIRKYYGVPAKRGGRVEYFGVRGTIISARGHHLNVLLDGSKCAMPFHPTWSLKYLDESAGRAALEQGGE